MLTVMLTALFGVCVALGVAIFLIGGGTWAQVPAVAGIGTIITAFFMGPLIQFFRVKVALPMLGNTN